MHKHAYWRSRWGGHTSGSLQLVKAKGGEELSILEKGNMPVVLGMGLR